MNEHEQARHDEVMAAHAANISSAHAATARAGADQASTALKDKEFDVATARSRRFEAVFEAASMENAMNRADLHVAFMDWPSWAGPHGHHGLLGGEG